MRKSMKIGFAILASLLFIPIFLNLLIFLVMVGGGILETIYILIRYGLSGLDQPSEWTWYTELRDFFFSILNVFIPIGGYATKMLLSVPLAFLSMLLWMKVIFVGYKSLRDKEGETEGPLTRKKEEKDA